MALEDHRCSPQSAPSPPGIPHSPQSTSSPLVIDMSIHGNHNHLLQHQQHTFINHYGKPMPMTTEISAFDQKMSLSVRNEDRLSPTAIKMEENDSIASEDQEIDQDANVAIDEDEEEHQHRHAEIPVQPPPLPMISFSITNILSDRFGKKAPCSDKKSAGSIFRPFEITRSPTSTSIPTNNCEKSAFTRLTPEAIDYSRTPQQQQHHFAGNPAAMIVDRASFLNCFNPAAYPRIHEEILNSSRSKYRHHHQSAEVKIPPLGSLCKTVSQIGQATSTISSPPPASSMSSASSTSASPSCRLPSSPQPIPPQSVSRDSGMESSDDTRSECGSTKDENGQQLWPAWVYCTRYSDRPSSGPRYRRPKQPKDKTQTSEEKRPRTAFSSEQLARLKREFNENRYLTERRRQQLSGELGLNEAQIKIWFQNKRAKIKKSTGTKNPLALQLMAQGLYNHSTVPLTKEEEELEMRMNGQL